MNLDTKNLDHFRDFFGDEIFNQIHNFSGHLIPCTRVGDHRLVEIMPVGEITDVEKILFTLNQRSSYERKYILERITFIHPDTVSKTNYPEYNEMILKHGTVSDFIELEKLRRRGQLTSKMLWSSILQRVEPIMEEELMPHVTMIPDFKLIIGRKLAECVGMHFAQKGYSNLSIVVLEA
jgi:hypothetical protein